jgi:hypothetical protein
MSSFRSQLLAVQRRIDVRVRARRVEDRRTSGDAGSDRGEISGSIARLEREAGNPERDATNKFRHHAS